MSKVRIVAKRYTQLKNYFEYNDMISSKYSSP